MAREIRVEHGDCREVIKALADESVDSCVTDPPYALVSIVNRFGKTSPNDDTQTSERARDRTDAYARASSGFMGAKWDVSEVVHDPAFWAEVLRVLKPGAHLAAFAGTRTYHRMVCAIEDAGFEIRDTVCWLYATGFPKSHDVSKGIDRAAGAKRESLGRSRAAITSGTGRHGGIEKSYGYKEEFELTLPATEDRLRWQGWGTALKPSHEPVVMARKPLANSTQWASIREQLIRLWSRLWLMLSASAAEQFSELNPSAYGVDVFASARWTVDDASSTRDALFAGMDTSSFASIIAISLSTVLSWNVVLAESCRAESTSITGMVISPTIDLRILRSFLSRITPESIIQAHRTGAWSSADASHAERYLSAIVASLRSTLELSALAPVIERELIDYLDVGAKPSLEPIVLARKPFVGTVAENVLRHGTGAINVDSCRIEAEKQTGWSGAPAGGNTWNDENCGLGQRQDARPVEGRWPANVVHDGSDEVLAAFDAFGERSSGQLLPIHDAKPSENGSMSGSNYAGRIHREFGGDSGSAARFFFSPKADASDRLGSRHPTVKPLDLMRWLVTLITPPGGVVLDPFAGSGSTGIAARAAGFDSILIERDEQYIKDIRERIAFYGLRGKRTRVAPSRVHGRLF